MDHQKVQPSCNPIPKLTRLLLMNKVLDTKHIVGRPCRTKSTLSGVPSDALEPQSYRGLKTPVTDTDFAAAAAEFFGPSSLTVSSERTESAIDRAERESIIHIHLMQRVIHICIKLNGEVYT